MQPEEDATIAGLWHRVTYLQREMDKGFTHLSKQIESFSFVRQEVFDVRHAALMDRVANLEEQSTWLKRALLITVMTAIASLVVTLGAAFLVGPSP